MASDRRIRPKIPVLGFCLRYCLICVLEMLSTSDFTSTLLKRNCLLGTNLVRLHEEVSNAISIATTSMILKRGLRDIFMIYR